MSVESWPKRIWLQHGDNDEVPPFDECAEVTWCQDQIHENDVGYVRADKSLKQTHANERIGSWLSAALEDPSVCEEMKEDVRYWFEVNT